MSQRERERGREREGERERERERSLYTDQGRDPAMNPHVVNLCLHVIFKHRDSVAKEQSKADIDVLLNMAKSKHDGEHVAFMSHVGYQRHKVEV